MPCTQQKIPIRVLLTVDPPKYWLNEDFSNATAMRSESKKSPIESLFGEKLLKIDDSEVRVFYQRSAGDSDVNLPPEISDLSLPLLLASQEAICREYNVPPGTPPTRSELYQGHRVRMAFRVS